MFVRPRLRHLLLPAGLVLASVLVTLGAIELVGRFLLAPLIARYSDNQALKQQLANPKDLGVISLYVPHHLYLYVTRPSYRSGDGKLRHNSLGCRAEEVPIPKPRGTYRVVALGGSTAYSTLVRENEETYTYKLEGLLNAWAARNKQSHAFEVLNCGVPGFTSAETLGRYIFALSEYEADLLIIQQGLNDVLPRSLPHLSRDYRHFSKTWEGFDPAKEGWFLTRLVHAARNRFTDSIWTQGISYVVRHPYWDERASGVVPENFTKNSPRIFAANTRYLIRLAAGDGARVLLLTEHLVTDATDRPTDWLPDGGIQAVLEHNRVLERLAREEGTLFLDLQAVLCGCGAIMPDGRHLNAAGETAKANAIFHSLRATKLAFRPIVTVVSGFQPHPPEDGDVPWNGR